MRTNTEHLSQCLKALFQEFIPVNRVLWDYKSQLYITTLRLFIPFTATKIGSLES